MAVSGGSQNQVDANLDQVGENLEKIEQNPNDFEGNEALLMANEHLLAQNDELLAEAEFKMMFQNGVIEAGSYDTFAQDMREMAAAELKDGDITQASHDRFLEIMEQSGNDADKFAKAMKESEGFMHQEAQKIQKDQHLLSHLIDGGKFMDGLQSGNMMQAFVGLIQAFLSGEGLDKIFSDLQKQAEQKQSQPSQGSDTVAKNEGAAKDVPAADTPKAEQPASEPPKTGLDPSGALPVEPEQVSANDGVGGVNGGAVNYVMIDGPAAAGEPVVNFDGGTSTSLSNMFDPLSSMDGFSYMQTDAKVEPEIQVPFRAPEVQAETDNTMNTTLVQNSL